MTHDYTYSPVGTFAYNPVGGALRYVNLSLNDAPAWDIRTDYATGQAVQRGTTYWIAIADNTGIDPSSSGQVTWSPLIPSRMGPSRGPQGPQGSTGGAYNNQVINFGPGDCQSADPGQPNNRRLEIESFSVLPNKVLIGQDSPVALQFAWTLNGTPFNQVLSPGNSRIPNNERHIDIAATIAATTTYTLEVWGKGHEDYAKATAVVQYTNSCYYGCSALESLTSSLVAALDHVDQDTRDTTRTFNPSGTYIYLAYPVRYGVAAIYCNGFYNTAWDITTQDVTNGQGYTEAYYVLRSSYLQQGTDIHIEVK